MTPSPTFCENNSEWTQSVYFLNKTNSGLMIPKDSQIWERATVRKKNIK